MKHHSFKVYLVYKHTIYQKYIQSGKSKHLFKLFQKNHPITRGMKQSHERHVKTICEVERILNRHGMMCKKSSRGHVKSFNNFNLIITIGGDGTFLRTAHHVNRQMILGINSIPETSVGAWCTMNLKQFKNRISKILAGKHEVQKFLRMKVKINGKTLPIEPVNDILFTSVNAAATSRYIIVRGKKREEHKSSGVWIATPKGSTAAIHAAGGSPQALHNNRLQFFVREPYQGISHPYRITKGFLDAGQKIRIINKMIKGRVFFDGPTRYHDLFFGDTLEVCLSKNTLKTVV